MIKRKLAFTTFLISLSGPLLADNKVLDSWLTIDEDAVMAATTSDELAKALRTGSTVTATAPDGSAHLFVYNMLFTGRDDPYSIRTHEIGLSLAPGGSVQDFPWTEGVIESNGADFPKDHNIWEEFNNFPEGWSGEKAWEPFAAAVGNGFLSTDNKFKIKDGSVPIEVVEIKHYEETLPMGPGQAMQDWILCCDDKISRGAAVEISLDPFLGHVELPDGPPPVFRVKKVVILVKPDNGWF